MYHTESNIRPWDISRHFDVVATGLHLKEYSHTELAEDLKQAGLSNVRILMSYADYILAPSLPVSFVSRIDVRMMFAGQFAIGFLDLVSRCVFANSQCFVIVFVFHA